MAIQILDRMLNKEVKRFVSRLGEVPFLAILTQSADVRQRGKNLGVNPLISRKSDRDSFASGGEFLTRKLGTRCNKAALLRCPSSALPGYLYACRQKGNQAEKLFLAEILFLAVDVYAELIFASRG